MTSADAETCAGTAVAERPDLSWLSTAQLRQIAGPDFRLCLDGLGPVEELDARDLRSAAIRLLPDLGIGESVWQEACQVFGSMGAALSLMVIDANRSHPARPIQSPGAALRAFTRLQAAGRFNLAASLIGLARRRRAGG